MEKKIHIITPEQKMTIQLWLGVLLAVFGIVMLIISFLVPPLGIIDSSVLAAIGEVFTFSGSLIGIDYVYKYKYMKYERKRNHIDDNADDITAD